MGFEHINKYKMISSIKKKDYLRQYNSKWRNKVKCKILTAHIRINDKNNINRIKNNNNKIIITIILIAMILIIIILVILVK